ncbi:MAG: hypothetical protein HOP19_04850 [Acidobacteria bacterium]|nr:hypothetical protein [Acidobacteriota bacterium]
MKMIFTENSRVSHREAAQSRQIAPPLLPSFSGKRSKPNESNNNLGKDKMQ